MTDILPCICTTPLNPEIEKRGGDCGMRLVVCPSCPRLAGAPSESEAIRMWNSAMSAPRLISMDKKYRTRDGRKVVLYDTAMPSPSCGQPVAGYMYFSDGTTFLDTWTATGAYRTRGSEPHNNDLVEDTE